MDDAAPTGAELYFGLVTPIGVRNQELRDALQGALRPFGYELETIQLSSYLDAALGNEQFTDSHEDVRIRHFIEAGNDYCERVGRRDGVVGPGIAVLQEKRRERAGGDGPAPRVAFVFSSLKRPEEVARLRAIYGRSFFLIAADLSRDARRQNLESTILGTRAHEAQAKDAAASLIKVDRSQLDHPYGQNVLQTYPQADLFVQLGDPREPSAALGRLVKLVFREKRDPWGTPTQQEYSMAIAESSTLRSGSLSRRVGAALVTEDGSIVATGTNEVAKAGGGHYWPGDQGDSRDVARGQDYSRVRIRGILLDALGRLGDYLTPAARERIDGDGDRLVDELFEGPMAGSELRDVVEYHRAVHAELSAILDAARRGVKTDATILYSTTYPCHLCAKEIVAAGVSRVVYIEPYPKSLANAMYSDSISEDEDAQRAIPFLSLVGISPRRFHEFFEEGRSLESTVSTTDQLPFTEPDWAFDRIKEREDDFVASLPD